MAMSSISEAITSPALGFHAPHALALWQADSINSGNSKLLMIFVGIAALAILGQAIALIAIAVGAIKAQKRVMVIVEELRVKAMPMIDKSHGLMDDLTPKIKDIAENAHQISFLVRDKLHEFEPTISAANVTLREANVTVQEANAKTREQISRVNGMITSALNATAEIAGTLHHSIRTPVREVAGLVTGVKVGIDTLIGRMQNLKSGIASARATRVTQVPKVSTQATIADSREVEFAPVVADRRDVSL